MQPIPLRVEPYRLELADKWDAFVRQNSRNGAIFHERKFLSYHPPDRFQDQSLMFYNQEDLLGVLPAALRPGDSKALVSHPGATFGGLVFAKRARVRDVLAMLDLALLYYRDLNVKSFELRLPETIVGEPFDGELPFLLWHRGFRLLSREISQGVPLDDNSTWLNMGRSKNPTDIRAAMRAGVSIQEHSGPEAIYPFIEANLKNRYQKQPTHTCDELKQIKLLCPDRVQFWSASIEDQLLGATVVFCLNQYAVHTFYITQDYNQSKRHPMPTLFYHLYNVYRERGFRWFNFGLSSREETIKWGILESKENWGGRSTYKDNWRLEDLETYRAYEFTAE